MDDRKLFKKSLAVNLTDEELLTHSKELAKVSQDKEAVERRKKEVADDFKAQVTKLEAEISILSRTIGNGYEYRDVECYWVYDWPRGKKSLMRTDTSEIVQSTNIEEHEKQNRLNLD